MMPRVKSDIATIRVVSDDHGIMVRIETLNDPVQARFVKNGQCLTAVLKGALDTVTRIEFTPMQKDAVQCVEDLKKKLAKPRTIKLKIMPGCGRWVLIFFGGLIYAILKFFS